MKTMTNAEKVGAILIVLWCIAWLFFIFLSPMYGTAVMH
jgi:hypothetical protein